jgi:hypothetical protein
MMTTTKAIIWIGFVVLACGTAHAQDEYGYETKFNLSAGTVISVPLNPSSQFVNIGWGLTSGAGYSFSRKHAVIGEFMWNKLYPTDAALQPVLVAFNKPQVGAYSNLFAITGNYRYELRGKALGMYLIGGGGWYHRNGKVTQQVSIGAGVTCDPAWIWWGYSCKSGTVTTGVTPANYSSSALGVNGGIGFTVRVGEAPYRFYVESRYHYAPTKTINTQLMDITIGIRY